MSDTIQLAVDSFPLIASLGNDSVFLCTGNTIGLVQGAAQATNYLWSTNDTTAVIPIFTSGNYSLQVQDLNGCIKIDSVYATILGLPPVANFSSMSACLGAAIQFTDLSFDPAPGDSIVSWQWSFDDFTTDTVRNPSHIFQTSGNHLAVLTVISSLGCPGSDSGVVAVHHVPAASFTNTTPCTINNVQFTNTSTIAAGDTINGWTWNFGNPASGAANTSLLQHPSHVFTDTGNFVVRLITSTTFGCSDTVFRVLLVKRASIANFHASPTCFGNLVQFTNLSTPALLDTAWRWDFGDGTGLNQFENPAHLYAFAQTYDVTLFVYASTGCVTTSTLPVTVSPIPVANFVHDAVCVKTPHLFMDSSYVSSGSIVKWSWNIGGLATDTLQNTVYTFTDTGNYVITHTVTSYIGCSKTITGTIHVNPLPFVNFSFNPPFGNPPLLVSFTNLTNNLSVNTYQWSFGDGNFSTDINPDHIYADTNFFAIKLVATSPFGCKDSAEKRIYVIRPVLDLGITGLSSSYISDNHLHIVVNIANLGTRDITNYKLSAFLDNGTPIEESFSETLATGTSKQLELSSSLDLGVGQSNYFCVHALKPNNTTDDVALNDEKCKSLTTNFSVADPFPNPFNDNLVLQMILPYKGEVRIELFDMIGKNYTIYEGIGHEGLNQYDAELGGLSNGPYAIRFMFKDGEIIKTILKIEKKK